MSIVAAFKSSGPSGFGYSSTAEEVTRGLDLGGKSYLVTGCNSGLGLETTRVLGMRGAHVVALARTEDKARAALAETGTAGTPVACELSEPESVRAAVARVKSLDRPLDGLIANAGVMAIPKLRIIHGYEAQFFTNHVGHFMLVTGLVETLADEGRVVMLSSGAHKMAPSGGIDFDNLRGERGYSSWRAYGRSKVANLLFARQLAKRLAGSGKTANAVHPGGIKTNLGRHMGRVANVVYGVINPLFLKTIPQGAATQCYVATHPDLVDTTGKYFADCNVARPSAHGEDDRLAERLWSVTEEIVAELSPN